MFYSSFIVPPEKPKIYEERGQEVRLKLGPYKIGDTILLKCVANGGKYIKIPFVNFYIWEASISFWLVIKDILYIILKISYSFSNMMARTTKKYDDVCTKAKSKT